MPFNLTTPSIHFCLLCNGIKIRSKFLAILISSLKLTWTTFLLFHHHYWYSFWKRSSLLNQFLLFLAKYDNIFTNLRIKNSGKLWEGERGEDDGEKKTGMPLIKRKLRALLTIYIWSSHLTFRFIHHRCILFWFNSYLGLSLICSWNGSLQGICCSTRNVDEVFHLVFGISSEFFD